MTHITNKKAKKLFYHIAECWLGYATIIASQDGISFLSLSDDKLRADLLPQAITNAQATLHPNQQHIKHALSYINDMQRTAPPLDLSGSPLQMKVWQALKEINYGTVSYYQQIAAMINMPNATRAVAHAIGQNPVAIILPCHRVIHKNKTIGGYRWGVDKKEKLLIKEGVEIKSGRLFTQ